MERVWIGILGDRQPGAGGWPTAGRRRRSRRRRSISSSAGCPATCPPSGSRSTLRRRPAERRAQPGSPAEITLRVPITSNGTTLGSIWARRTRQAGLPERPETRVLSAAADQLGRALERDRLVREAMSIEVARRSDALKSALLDSVSHDLRTPLASIRAAAGSLMDPAVNWSPEDERATAASIDREADRLNRLVSNILDLSRIEAGGLVAHHSAFPLEDLVPDVLERLEPVLGERPIEVDIPAGLPPVDIDEVFIDQVLTNLLENTARYAGPGVTVRIAARDARAGADPADDRGCRPGVPADALPHLFEKFYRVPAERRGRPAGNRPGPRGGPRPGRDDGRPDHGSAVASSAAWPWTSSCERPRDRARRGPRSCSSRTTRRRATRSPRCSSVTATGSTEAADAESALGRVRGAATPDLILLDLGLPGPRRPGGRRPGAGGGDDADPRPVGSRPRGRQGGLALEAGADDYLAKPFGMAELQARIGAVLRRAGPRGADPDAAGNHPDRRARARSGLAHGPRRREPGPPDAARIRGPAGPGRARRPAGHVRPAPAGRVGRRPTTTKPTTSMSTSARSGARSGRADPAGRLAGLIVPEPGVGYRVRAGADPGPG